VLVRLRHIPGIHPLPVSLSLSLYIAACQVQGLSSQDYTMNVDRPTRGLRIPWRARHLQTPHHHEIHVVRPLSFLNFLPKPIKGHIVACVGEFVGTFLFLLFALGGTNVVNTAPAEGANATDLSANPSKIMYIALVFGMSLAVNAWVFFRVSGGLFNPAVTLGMMIVGATGYLRGVLVIVSQILGGIAASAVVLCMMPNPLAVKTELGGGTSVAQGLFIEVRPKDNLRASF
jgi:aquaporin related protein